MSTIRVITCVCVVGLLAGGCGGTGLCDPSWGDVSSRQTVDSSNAFAFDLYAQLKTDGGNLVFSPLSVSTALAMVYMGASEATESQMRDVLHFSQDQWLLHSSISSTTNDLLQRADASGVELCIANSVWADHGIEVLDAYQQRLKNYYGAELGRLDFSDTEGVRATLNKWAARQTKGRIRDIVPPGALGKAPMLALANAIYFKADWQQKFVGRATRPEWFYVTPEDKIRVPMMGQQSKFAYTEDDECQVLSMSYQGGDLSMVILLPRERDGLADFESRLDEESVNALIQALRRQEVYVVLPKFTMTRFVDLGRVLQTLGMADAFREGADFSGINGSKSVWIGAALHKAFIEVNERGTEAAAVTVVMLEARSKGGGSRKIPPVFRADHPFMFMIRDNRSGSILFMGRVVKPDSVQDASR